MMKTYGILPAAFICIVFCIRCVEDNPARLVENIPDAPAITGVINNIDGTPSGSAAVHIRRKNTLADITGTPLVKKTADTRSTTTDDHGRFSFNADMEPDTYVVEATNGSAAVLIDSVIIVQKAVDVELAPATLKPVGAIQGTVLFAQESELQNLYVLLFGIDRFSRVNADGSFLFADLAEGVYTLRLLSTSGDYGEIDWEDIPVNAAETTVVEPVELPHRTLPVPVPDNVITEYDTMEQKVTIRWNGIDTAVVNGYYVFKRNVDSNTVFERTSWDSPIVDTIFIDQTGKQDETYEYRITAVDKNGQESKKSEAIQVTFATCFTVDTVFSGQTYNIRNFEVASNGDFYTCEPRTEVIMVFDSLMNYKKEFGNAINQYGRIAVGEEYVFAVQYDHRHEGSSDSVLNLEYCLVFDSTGALIDTLLINDLNEVRITGLATFGNLLALSLCKTEPETHYYVLSIFTTGGIKLNEWKCGKDLICTDLTFADSSRILAGFSETLESPMKVVMYDPEGNSLSETTVPCGWRVEDLAYDLQKQWLYVLTNCDGTGMDVDDPDFLFDMDLQGMVYVINAGSSIIANYRLFDYQHAWLGLQPNGGLVIAGEEKVIRMQPLER